MFHALHKIQWNKQWNKQTYNQKNSQRKFEKQTKKTNKESNEKLKNLKKEKNRAATAESSLLVCYQNQSAAARGFSEIGESRSKNPRIHVFIIFVPIVHTIAASSAITAPYHACLLMDDQVSTELEEERTSSRNNMSQPGEVFLPNNLVAKHN